MRRAHLNCFILFLVWQQCGQFSVKAEEQIQENHKTSFASRINLSKYLRYNEINSGLATAASRCSSYCKVTCIGKSVERRSIKMLEIVKNKRNPYIFLDAGIHAREWIAPATAMYIIDQLTKYQANIVNKWNFYIVPTLNPDGYEYSHTKNRMWRKNRRRHGSCFGTDMNRNFGFKWGGKGTSKDPCRDTYRGSRAFSEPESRALRDWIQPRVRNIALYMTFHSFGRYLLVPYGYDNNKKPKNYNEMLRVAKLMGKTLNRNGGSYKVGHSANLMYPAAGGSDDWASSIGIPYAYTVELPAKKSFILPPSQIRPVGKQTMAGLKTMLANLKVRNSGKPTKPCQV